MWDLQNAVSMQTVTSRWAKASWLELLVLCGANFSWHTCEKTAEDPYMKKVFVHVGDVHSSIWPQMQDLDVKCTSPVTDGLCFLGLAPGCLCL